jgi:excisionase family DNA binding protein
MADTSQNLFEKLDRIEQMLEEQALLRKELLSFKEACIYLDISASGLYRLTSTRRVPHFCPNGKKLYFKRTELDQWLQSNKKKSTQELESAAASFIFKSKAL